MRNKVVCLPLLKRRLAPICISIAYRPRGFMCKATINDFGNLAFFAHATPLLGSN
jgi:hypothetical protein